MSDNTSAGGRGGPDGPDDESVEQEQPFISHLLELRDRLLRVVLVVVIIFAGMFAFRNHLYHFLATPLLAKLPKGATLIATQPTGPFFAPVKLALATSIFAAMPFILYQAWGFIAPGLYRHEKTMVMPLLISSIVLFYLGVAFAYYAIFPVAFGFFASVTPVGVTFSPDINHYLDLVLKMFFAFGLAFEVPIAIILLVWMDIVTPDSLSAKRPYIVVFAFILGMVLTPPDVVSQILLAMPLWLLFELGLLASRVVVRRKREREAAEEEEYRDLSEEEMDAELDRAEREEADLGDSDAEGGDESGGDDAGGDTDSGDGGPNDDGRDDDGRR